MSQDSDVLMAFALYTGDVEAALSAVNAQSARDVPVGTESPDYDRLWTSWCAVDGALSTLSDLTVGVKMHNGRFLVHLGAAESG